LQNSKKSFIKEISGVARTGVESWVARTFATSKTAYLYNSTGVIVTVPQKVFGR